MYSENIYQNRCAKPIYLENTQILPQFSPFFGHFWARKIQMSKYLRLLPFPISQMFVSDEKSWSINVYFPASGNLPYFQITDFNVLKNNRYITNKIVPTQPPFLKPRCI